MRIAFSIAALAAIASASPLVVGRDHLITDIQILNYALTLEHLEDKFYRDGLAKFTREDFIAAGFPDPFYANLREVSRDETIHVSFLSQALGSSLVDPCTYNFPYTDVASFVSLAAVLEGVGVSAYLGAAALIAEPGYVTAAGSILTVEARHSSYLRASKKQSPFPQPFDDPLTYNQVFTLAAGFITSCPASNANKPSLPLKAFPALSLSTASSTIKSGDTIDLSTPRNWPIAKEKPVYAAFIALTGPKFVVAQRRIAGYSVVVPKGVNGQVYVVLTMSPDTVNDETVAAGPVIVEVTN